MKTIKFITLGCKANQYDTQSIRERFLKCGFKEVKKDPANFYLINTCTVTSVADRKSRNIIRNCIKNNSRATVIVTGCLAQKDQAALSSIKGINLIIAKGFFKEGITNFSARSRAFLKVQDGCNNFCSYCKVPLVRGRSRSRSKDEIIKEARQLACNGFQEIVITGVCLGAYGKDFTPDIHLADLLSELEDIPQLMRIRLSSIEAWDIDNRLIESFSRLKKLCPHLHIPIQSGDNTILKKMNRKVTHQRYLDIVKRLKKKIPDLAVTTDVIVGFPGESENDFKQTLNLIKKICPLKIHAFPFSPRPGTLADRIEDKVVINDIKRRISILNDLAKDCTHNYMKTLINKPARILIEGRSKQDKRYVEGFSDNYVKTLIKSPDKDPSAIFARVVFKKIKHEQMLAEILD